MSERDLKRLEVLAQVDDGRLSVDNASNLLGLTHRQVFRLLKRYRQGGATAIRHKARGKPPNNHIHKDKRDYALCIIKESYADFGPTFAAEMLVEHHGFKVSRETVRKWMQEDGIWLSRRQRRTFHQPRLRREYFGELIQIDGSDHRWFEDRGDPCTLLVFIDDATSALMELRFVTCENTFSYFEALESYLLKHGRPVAFYSDKHTVFRVPKPNEQATGMTQFGRALSELNIEIICANSSQAKGRVERANRTLQDRLVKELRIAGISNMEDGNAFLVLFMERYNAKFAKAPAKPDNLHRGLNIAPDRLAEVFCLRHKRYVTRDLTLRYEGKRIRLEVNDLTRSLVGKYVDVHEMPDGRIHVHAKGVALPCSIFDPHQQRVSHAAITENKHLRAALAHIKKKQEKATSKSVMSIRRNIITSSPFFDLITQRHSNFETDLDALAHAVEGHLRGVPDMGSIDGFNMFHVLDETNKKLRIAGIAYFMPSSSIPLEASFNMRKSNVSYRVKLGADDDKWQRLTHTERRSAVYLYATENYEPQWNWEPTLKGPLGR